MRYFKGTLQYDEKRGVIYFTDEAGQLLLRVEGVRDVPADHQIDIHLAEPGGAHHHAHCSGLPQHGALPDPGMFCAEKIQKQTSLVSCCGEKTAAKIQAQK